MVRSDFSRHGRGKKYIENWTVKLIVIEVLILDISVAWPLSVRCDLVSTLSHRFLAKYRAVHLMMCH